jgi:exopolysaccharide biosynthesis polyprenyl glycosylphosphotransferase
VAVPPTLTRQRSYHRSLLLLTVAGDFVFLNLATLLTLFGRHNLFGLDTLWKAPLETIYVNLYLNFFTYVKVSLATSVVTGAVFFNRGLYDRQRAVARLDELFLVLRSLIFATFFILALSLFIPDFPYTRAIVIGNFILSLAFIDAWRILLRKLIAFLAARGVGLSRIIIYGAGKSGRILSNQIRHHPEFGFSVVGFVDDDAAKQGRLFEGVKVLGSYQDLPALLTAYDVDEVLVSLPSAAHRDLLNVVFDLRERRIPFMVLADLFELVTRRVSVTQVGSIPLLRLWREPLDGWQGYVKRLLDVGAAVGGIILTAPLWLVTMALIKLDSRGPIFFRQERVGKNGRVFRIFKFRSMVVGADEMMPELAEFNEMAGPIFKIKKDPRVTRVGKWLRRFSLDELPQLLNVLLGDMSLVGPRPPLPREAARYERWQAKRLAVAQGMTGLWQVSGRNLLTFEEMVRLDIYYIENWSLWLDLKILLKTIPVALLMRGAY